MKPDAGVPNSPKSRAAKNLLERPSFLTLLSFAVAFMLGAVILLLAGFDPLAGYRDMFVGIFGQPKYIGWSILKATPLIMTGLSVAFSLKTGLFNLGAEGQYMIGAMAASLVGVLVPLPPVIHPFVCLLAGMAAAGLWGAVAGYLKAKWGIHEVLSCIMLNWIAFYAHNELVIAPWFNQEPNKAKLILPTADIRILGQWKVSPEGQSFLQGHPILQSLAILDLNWGFLYGLILVALVWFLLKHTRLGYELRAVGYAPEAARHAGIPVERRLVLSMFLSGALAGAAGSLQLLGVSRRISTLTATEGNGFDGIAVALMGNLTPFGCLLGALFYGALKYGGTKMAAPPEVSNILIGVVMLCLSAPKLFTGLLRLRPRGKEASDT